MGEEESDSSVVCQSAPADSSNSMATQKALIKSRRANLKPKDIKVETTLVGKGNVQGRE